MAGLSLWSIYVDKAHLVSLTLVYSRTDRTNNYSANTKHVQFLKNSGAPVSVC